MMLVMFGVESSFGRGLGWDLLLMSDVQTTCMFLFVARPIFVQSSSNYNIFDSKNELALGVVCWLLFMPFKIWL